MLMSCLAFARSRSATACRSDFRFFLDLAVFFEETEKDSESISGSTSYSFDCKLGLSSSSVSISLGVIGEPKASTGMVAIVSRLGG